MGKSDLQIFSAQEFSASIVSTLFEMECFCLKTSVPNISFHFDISASPLKFRVKHNLITNTYFQIHCS